MKKKIVLLALCAVLVWCGFISWNWARVFSDLMGIAYQVFDIIAGLCALGALALGCKASGEVETKTE